MAIHCPYCQQTMELKGAHPGRYTPKCTACHGQFLLMIPEGVDGAPFVKAIPGGEPQADAIEDALGLEHPMARKSTEVQQPPPQYRKPETPRKQAAATLASVSTAPASNSVDDEIDRHKAIAPAGVTAPPAAAASQHAISAPLPPAPPPEDPIDDIHLAGSLGGYEIKHKLGQGGMGAVFLARQVSLDRNVAIKVLAPKLAADPQFISRFTREAYAAAQLTHHNVVQIHDIGVDKDLNYFSMEFVEGNTLAGLLKETGKLDPQVAAGYILQAARGLKFAHDHGMVHRDVKPDNLLLNDDGIVKVADLGLVKRAGTADEKPAGGSSLDGGANVTQLNISMGTPAFMPPEQASDAAHVDQRADIYSLGCTFYDLLTGHPPFSGKTAIEVITKHAREAVTPPDRLAKHVPAMLSTVVMKMMAKRPEDRYQNMGAVITAIEEYLGVDSGKPFSPKEEHVKVLEFAAQRFNESKYAGIGRWIIKGFFAITLLAAVVCALPKIGYPLIAGGLIGFAVLTAVIYQITKGITQRTFVFMKFRQLIFGANLIDWLKYLILTAAIVSVLYAFNLHLMWLGFGVLAVGAAMAFHFTIDLLTNKERATPVHQTETMLKQMRLRGLDENALRHFVCRYAGEQWEAFYEALFGYEAKMQARQMWGKSDRGRERKKYAAWRDSFIAWVDHKQRLRKESRERKILAKLEAKALRAKGIDEVLAARQAKKSAERFVDKAAHLKETSVQRSAVTALPGKAMATASMAVVQSAYLYDDADTHHDEKHPPHKRESYLKRRFGGPLDFVFGKQVRFIATVLILAGFAMWWNKNGGWEVKKNLADMQGQSENPADIAARKVITTAKEQVKAGELQSKRSMEPLRVTAVPDWVCNGVGSWNGGLAGTILAISLIFTGKLLGLGVLVSAVIAMFAHRLNLPILHDQAWLAATIAAALAAVSLFFFRETAGA